MLSIESCINQLCFNHSTKIWRYTKMQLSHLETYFLHPLVKCFNQWEIPEQAFYFYNTPFFTPPSANADKI